MTALDLDCPLSLLSTYWPPILQSISTITSTHQLGKIVPGSFSTKMQRRLASTVPPRPIVELDFKDALEKLRQLCIDCKEATRFTMLPPDPLEYQAFLYTFSSRMPTPLPYSRSYLATILFHPDILNASISPPLADVKSLVFPASPILNPINWTFSPPRNSRLPQPPRLRIALLIDDFVERSGQPYLDLWVALGQNRCRLRRMLTHVILSWDVLQADAASLDADLAEACQELSITPEVLTNPLSTWVYNKKLWMIEKIILLGVEQDIYLPDELAGMYHFLSIISAKRADVLARCSQHTTSRLAHVAQTGSYDDAQEVDDAAAYIESECNQAKGISAFATALHGFYTVLLYLRLIPVPNRPFSSEHLRYELRMKPFLTLQPPEVPPFPAFQAALQPYGSYGAPTTALEVDLRNPESALWTDVDSSIRVAKDAFLEVKRLGPQKSRAAGVEVAWGKELQGMLASCVALGVAVASVKSAVKDEANKVGLGIKAEIPAAGAGKRYAEGLVVVKVVKE